jgi:hypothetical protein
VWPEVLAFTKDQFIVHLDEGVANPLFGDAEDTGKYDHQGKEKLDGDAAKPLSQRKSAPGSHRKSKAKAGPAHKYDDESDKSPPNSRGQGVYVLKTDGGNNPKQC